MREWLVPILKYAAYAAFAVGVIHWAQVTRSETIRLGRECSWLRTEIVRSRQHNALRANTHEALESDPFYVERVLRERYGYQSGDEEAPARPNRLAPPARPRDTAPTAIARTRSRRSRP